MAYLRSFFAFTALAMTFVQYSWAVRVPDDYDTIQAAMTALKANPGRGNTINVSRGVYSENIIFNDSGNTITIIGEETAATFLEAENESEAILSMSGVSNIIVRNFTFRKGNLGIDLTNSSDVIIASNIFRLGGSGDGIVSDISTDADIINNTFYDNNTAVNRGSETTEIKNNIFNNNNIAISPDTLEGVVSYNCFDDNGVADPNSVRNSDPLFVNSRLGDFHLKENSPCIDEGDGTDVIDDTDADMGAYGGNYTDVFPFKVQNVVVSNVEGTLSIAVAWSANQSYRVSGYKLYYDSDQSGPPYEGTDATAGTQPSPIDVGNVTDYKIENLMLLDITPTTPTISNIIPSSQTLDISWGATTSATGYRLHYGVNDDPNENQQVDVGAVTTYSLSGLTDGVTYNIAVSALNQATYYLSVTAVYDNTGAQLHESNHSDEKSLAIGNENESDLSESMRGIPEAVVPFPQLSDEGCFIATAAFGYYDAPQVQLLRDFRDRYLLSHSPGRWFVKQYYAHGSKAARYIEQHPEWKSSVRVALLPLIAMAWVLFKASWFVLAVIALIGLTMVGGMYLWRKKQVSVLITLPGKFSHDSLF